MTLLFTRSESALTLVTLRAFGASTATAMPESHVVVTSLVASSRYADTAYDFPCATLPPCDGRKKGKHIQG